MRPNSSSSVNRSLFIYPHVVIGVDPLYSRFFVLNIKKSSPTEDTPTVSLLEVSTSGSCNPGEWIIFI